MHPAAARRPALLKLLPLAAAWALGLGAPAGCTTDEVIGDPAATADMAGPAPDLLKDTRLDPDEILLKVAQRCPGDPGCPDSGDNVLYAGVAKRDITPEVEPFTDTNKNNVWDPGEPYTDKNGNGQFDAYWMAGFGQNRLAFGVHDPTWARALALRYNQTTVVLVAVDALGLFRDESVAIEKLLDKKLGIDLLLVHATHLHETADVVGGWGPDVATNGINPYYQQRVRKLVAEAVTEAVQAVKPARLTLGSINVADGPSGDMTHYVGDARDPVVIDNRLHTLQLSDISDPMATKPIATVINWAHHPESVGDKNHDITSDFVYYLRGEIEKAGGGTALYISGALGGQIGPGGVVPLDDKGLEVRGAGFAKAEAIGKSVARFALQAMADPKATTVAGKDAKVAFRSTVFPVRVDNAVYHLAFMLGIYKREMCCYDTKRPISEDNVPATNTAAAYLQLGPASIITNPGELLPELFVGGYGGEYAGTYTFIDRTQKNPPDVSKAPKPPYLVDIMDGPRQHRMTFGLTMDFLGYIVPRYNFVLSDKSPYFDEAEGDHYEETNSIGPYAEPQIVGSLRQLVLDGRPNVAR
ncbi:MAG: hypothetical protein U1A78_04265 [Polyangia bacterium]